MSIHQQTPDCADFDVDINGLPAFRALLPELFFADGRQQEAGLHRIPGPWTRREDGMDGRVEVPGHTAYSVSATQQGPELAASLAVKNLTAHEMIAVYVDICTALNHLPGEPGWANPAFFSGVPLDRDVQGRLWYETFSAQSLSALVDDQWVAVHPNPEDPSADKVPQYSFTRSPSPNAVACAVQRPDGKAWFYQAWNTDCFYITPSRGNACMHLHPRVAHKLSPGQELGIRAIIGIHEGDRDSLTERIREFRAATLS